jgi:presenilin 1
MPSELPPAAHQQQQQPRRPGDPEDEGEIELPDSIKLGLGDFIFYSMLVGRAAMYDYMTVFASYLGIVAGLGITLLCLAFYQRALPALPFSIALGVLFYFLTRLVLEPFIVPLSATLTFF